AHLRGPRRGEPRAAVVLVDLREPYRPSASCEDRARADARRGQGTISRELGGVHRRDRQRQAPAGEVTARSPRRCRCRRHRQTILWREITRRWRDGSKKTADDLILRASASRLKGPDYYDVLSGGEVVGCIFLATFAAPSGFYFATFAPPRGKPWMWKLA